jgi:hypothetical protein
MFFHKDKYKRQRSSFLTFTPEIYGSFFFRQAQKLIEKRFFLHNLETRCCNKLIPGIFLLTELFQREGMIV